MDRTRIFGGVGVIVVLNALASRINGSLSKGFWLSLGETFGVSAIIWLALGIIVSLTLANPAGEAADCDAQVRPIDAVLAAIIVLLSLIPSPALAASALVPFSLWGVMASRRATVRHRTAVILLSLTLTLFWGPLALRFMPEILQADAHVVAWLIGGEAQGNIYASPDGSHHFLVEMGCSSLNNMSLATIFTVSLTQYFGLTINRKIVAAIILASLATISVNIARMATLALLPNEFSYWHTGGGAMIFGWIAFTGIILIIGLAIDRSALDAAR